MISANNSDIAEIYLRLCRLCIFKLTLYVALAKLVIVFKSISRFSY